MATEPRRDAEEVLVELDLTRANLRKIEADWKYWREHSKQLALELITEQGFSVLKASQLTGHHRNTLKVWLDLHNAERREPPGKKQ